ncbi:MAG: hypothetical protein EPN34_00780 [Burkholderiaceae bacterium]|nr:MAG: hypothetical protein EPN34_00780 [Burkholderiaceae bacterium]
MFNNRSIIMQLARGALALAAIVGAILLANHAWAVVPLVLIAIFLMRGCPMCWLSGLFEAFAERRARKAVNAGDVPHLDH